MPCGRPTTRGTRLLGLLVVASQALLGGCERSATVSDADGGPGSTGPTVSVERYLGFGGRDVPLVRGTDLELRGSGVVELHRHDSSVLRLEAPFALYGWRASPGEFRWLVTDGTREVGREDAAKWFFVGRAGGVDRRRLGDELVDVPVLVRWATDGGLRVVPTPEGVEVRHLGVGADGTPWVLAETTRTAVIDGVSVGAEGERHSFTAWVGPSGLTAPREVLQVASGTSATSFIPWGDGTDLLWGLRVAGEGMLLGSRVSRGFQGLVRFDPATGEGSSWASTTWVFASRDEGMVRLHLEITGRTSFGTNTYEPLPPFRDSEPSESWLEVQWDGRGDPPPGELWPVDPRATDPNGIHISRLDRAIFTAVGAGRSILRRVSVDGAHVYSAGTTTGGVWAALIDRDDGEAPVLHNEGPSSETWTPSPEVTGAGLWIVELSPDTGELNHDRHFAVGEDLGGAHAQPLARGHFLVGRSVGGEGRWEVLVSEWSSETPTPLELTVAGGDDCELDMERPRLGPDLVEVVARCSGPHEVSLAEARVAYQTPVSRTFFRVMVGE